MRPEQKLAECGQRRLGARLRRVADDELPRAHHLQRALQRLAHPPALQLRRELLAPKLRARRHPQGFQTLMMRFFRALWYPKNPAPPSTYQWLPVIRHNQPINHSKSA